jgi:DNA integrity scanning protein DisA with diadenylate cyclase activity
MTYQELENENHDLNLQIMKLCNDLDKEKNTIKRYRKKNKSLTDYILKKLKDFNTKEWEETYGA